jgi:hypothetical protein
MTLATIKTTALLLLLQEPHGETEPQLSAINGWKVK